MGLENKQDALVDSNFDQDPSFQTEGEEQEEEKVLFVCSQCKNISFLTQEFWNHSPKKRGNLTRSQIIHKDKNLESDLQLIFRDSYFDWDRRIDYENLKDFVKKKELVGFLFV